jgi:hypothetical protein
MECLKFSNFALGNMEFDTVRAKVLFLSLDMTRYQPVSNASSKSLIECTIGLDLIPFTPSQKSLLAAMFVIILAFKLDLTLDTKTTLVTNTKQEFDHPMMV